MLVLSRRPNEKIVFPTLGITVEIVNIARNAVRLGIEAPPSIRVLREELADDSDEARSVPEVQPAGHRTRNRLHTACLAVHLAQKQLQAGRTQEASITLDEALRELSALEEEFASCKTETAPRRREVRALLVEDNHNESALLAEFLRLHGIKVATASDGHEALDYLKANDRPDVVLLDMRMPRCDGPATVAAIRRNPAYEGLKVFAVSGADPRECPVATGSQGVDAWFSKPINPAKLILQVNAALGRN